MATSWTIAIDWDRDGNFSGQHDDVTAYVSSARWFLGERTPYQDTADNSTLSLVLNSSDRCFSPENPSSPLAGKLAPFRLVRIQSDDGTTVRTHWTGWIESIQPQVNVYGERTVEITAAGPMQFFKAAETALELQENLRTDEIIAALIKEVVIPPALAGAWLVGRVGNSELGKTTFLANTTSYSALDTGITTLALHGDPRCLKIRMVPVVQPPPVHDVRLGQIAPTPTDPVQPIEPIFPAAWKSFRHNHTAAIHCS